MIKKKITIVDYGLGNLFSVQRAFEVCEGVSVHITSDPSEIIRSDRLVLPGVGSFRDGMEGLKQRGQTQAICEFFLTGRPLLGICLGMQLFATLSEEFGTHLGLNLVPGRVLAIPSIDQEGGQLRSPFIGWSQLNSTKKSTQNGGLLKSFNFRGSVYLVHSFQLIPDDEQHRLATYRHGGHEITAAVNVDNLTGLQFHPERSGPVGIEILRNFTLM